MRMDMRITPSNLNIAGKEPKRIRNTFVMKYSHL